MRIVHVMLLLLLSLASLGLAQSSNSGTVFGSITDPSGALVPTVVVRLQDSSTGEVRSVISNDSGRYTFVGVKPGRYSMTATGQGFQQSVIPSVLVEVGKSITMHFQLLLGQSTEQVQVVASAGAELQVLDATVGNTIGGETLMMLPSQQRNVTSLLLLQPAAMPQQGPDQGSNLGGQVAGARSDQNTFLLDGGNITAGASGDSAYWNINNGAPEGPIPTPVESIEEFKVATNNHAASFGSSAGSQIMLVTKRGTGRFRGSVYDYLQNDNLNSNSWDRNRLGQARPESKDNRFGASLGGYLPKIGSDRTYFYLHYEGRRLVGSTQVQRLVPTSSMKQGILRFRDAAGNLISYNLASSQQCGAQSNTSCDPRTIGLNPLVRQIWDRYMPEGNDPTRGDGLNTLGFSGPARLPVNNDFAVLRLDRTLSSKWQLMGSYRWFREAQAQTRQFDIGGFLPGNTKGVAASSSSIPRQPRFLVLGLTGQISPTSNNEFRFSHLRDYWSWDTAGAAPQVPGTAAALELGGENTNALIPMNLNATSIRTRAWNSQHWSWTDNFSTLRGNHLIQFGGGLTRNTIQFQRSDGQTSLLDPVYIVTATAGLNIPAAYRPAPCSTAVTTNCLPANQVTNWNNLYSQMLGLVDSAAMLRTRDASLSLNPTGTPIRTNTNYNIYNLYFTDAWRIRPSLTLSYGLNWGVGMPPKEESGKLSIAMDSSGKPIDPVAYLDKRKSAALQGQIYNPVVSFVPVGSSGMEYPFHPVWNSFGPRVAMAWNPSFTEGWKAAVLGKNKTVIRGGYSRLYDRLNGVQTVIDPQQGLGFTVNVQCLGPSTSGQCLGNAGVDPRTAFRPGTDGSTIGFPALADKAVTPIVPGVAGFPGANTAFTTSSYHLDPNYRPAANDQIDFTVQRELPGGIIVEAGYIGRFARNLFSSVQLNQAPFFMTSGGQSFAQAYDSVAGQIRQGAPVAPQPFFESALAGSSFCASPAASCTAGVVSRFSGTFTAQQVLNLWNGIQPSFVLGPATASTNQLNSLFFYNSQGHSNYNAGFLSFRQRFADSLTLNANLTWSRSLDENGKIQTSDNAFSNSFDPRYDYGVSVFDRKFVFNLYGLYNLPFRKRDGVLNKVIADWSVAPVFAWYSGLPIKVAAGSSQEFGQSTANNAQAILNAPNTFGTSVHSGIAGDAARGIATAGNPAAGGSGLNLFADPVAVYNSFRPILLSLDTTSGGGGRLRGQSRYNLDLTISRKFRFTERLSTSFSAQIFNVFNHVQYSDPSLNVQSPQTFGVISTQLNLPRAIVLGLHIDF